MRYFLLGLLVLMVTGCVPKAVNIDVDAELIPAEQALAFFRSDAFDAGGLNIMYPCIMINTRLYNRSGFHLYEDLKFVVRRSVMDGANAHFVRIQRKGEDYGNFCDAYYGYTDLADLQTIATALVSLGTEPEIVERIQ